MTRLVYLDQNAWVTLAKGSWDKERYPKEHAALTKVIELVCSGSITAPLTFANIYETSKINVPGRRANIALAQSQISGGRVFRGRRRILAEGWPPTSPTSARSGIRIHRRTGSYPTCGSRRPATTRRRATDSRCQSA